jgi:hypothetical protein
MTNARADPDAERRIAAAFGSATAIDGLQALLRAAWSGADPVQTFG